MLGLNPWGQSYGVEPGAAHGTGRGVEAAVLKLKLMSSSWSPLTRVLTNYYLIPQTWQICTHSHSKGSFREFMNRAVHLFFRRINALRRITED